jgi:putative flippase GtrA
MQQNNPVEILKVVLSIRMKESKNFIRFLAVGTVGMVTDFSFANLFKFSKMQSNYAATMSAVIAMFTTFMLNNLWSFDDRKITGSKAMAQSFVPYVAFSSVPIIFRFWFVGFMTGRINDSYLIYNGAILTSIVLGIFWNYFTYSRFIWRREHPDKRSRLSKKKEAKVDPSDVEAEIERVQKSASSKAKKEEKIDPELQKKIEEKMKEIKS